MNSCEFLSRFIILSYTYIGELEKYYINLIN